ncbi:MAG: UDP-N-acetylmuramate--L-alanine ligase [Patescibacteria group bacterium]
MQKIVQLEKCHAIHFIGIGGIGISAAARISHAFGMRVTGSDITQTGLTRQLNKEGITCIIGKHSASNVPKDADLIVFSNALASDNPELKKGQKLGIPSLTYPEFMGQLMKSYIQLVVTGTHGKSTTTSMLAHILIAAGLDPTVIVGAHIDAFQGNARVGLGRHFIIEGDEYKKAFHSYRPYGLIVNNIEADHLDVYKDEEAIVRAFKALIKRMPRGGCIAVNIMDSNSIRAVEGAPCKIITYGIGFGDLHVTNILRKDKFTLFSVSGIDKFDLSILQHGRHNVLNALAAASLAYMFGIRTEHIAAGLRSYGGAARRFEIKGTKNGITVVDDYAHHPTAIKETLRTAKDFFANRRIWCIFQPHSAHRTESLFTSFRGAFTDCDQLIITDTYKVAGRELKAKRTAKDLAAEIGKRNQPVHYAKNFNDAIKHFTARKKRGDVVITMGAGTITDVSGRLLAVI